MKWSSLSVFRKRKFAQFPFNCAICTISHNCCWNVWWVEWGGRRFPPIGFLPCARDNNNNNRNIGGSLPSPLRRGHPTPPIRLSGAFAGPDPTVLSIVCHFQQKSGGRSSSSFPSLPSPLPPPTISSLPPLFDPLRSTIFRRPIPPFYAFCPSTFAPFGAIIFACWFINLCHWPAAANWLTKGLKCQRANSIILYVSIVDRSVGNSTLENKVVLFLN